MAKSREIRPKRERIINIIAKEWLADGLAKQAAAKDHSLFCFLKDPNNTESYKMLLTLLTDYLKVGYQKDGREGKLFAFFESLDSMEKANAATSALLCLKQEYRDLLEKKKQPNANFSDEEKEMAKIMGICLGIQSSKLQIVINQVIQADNATPQFVQYTQKPLLLEAITTKLCKSMEDLSTPKSAHMSFREALDLELERNREKGTLIRQP